MKITYTALQTKPMKAAPNVVSIVFKVEGMIICNPGIIEGIRTFKGSKLVGWELRRHRSVDLVGVGPRGAFWPARVGGYICTSKRNSTSKNKLPLLYASVSDQ